MTENSKKSNTGLGIGCLIVVFLIFAVYYISNSMVNGSDFNLGLSILVFIPILALVGLGLLIAIVVRAVQNAKNDLDR